VPLASGGCRAAKKNPRRSRRKARPHAEHALASKRPGTLRAGPEGGEREWVGDMAFTRSACRRTVPRKGDARCDPGGKRGQPRGFVEPAGTRIAAKGKASASYEEPPSLSYQESLRRGSTHEGAASFFPVEATTDLRNSADHIGGGVPLEKSISLPELRTSVENLLDNLKISRVEKPTSSGNLPGSSKGGKSSIRRGVTSAWEGGRGQGGGRRSLLGMSSSDFRQKAYSGGRSGRAKKVPGWRDLEWWGGGGADPSSAGEF